MDLPKGKGIAKGGSKHIRPDVENTEIHELEFHYGFFSLSLKGQRFLTKWCQKNGLLCRTGHPCPICRAPTRLYARAKKKADEQSFRCKGCDRFNHERHEIRLCNFSYFGHYNFPLADVLLSIRGFLLEEPLRKLARNVGVSYNRFVVDWCYNLRRIIAIKMRKIIFLGNRQLHGVIEIDETFLRHKTKYNYGRRRGNQVCILGFLCRGTGELLTFPIDRR